MDDYFLYIGVGSLSYDNFLPIEAFDGTEYNELKKFLRSRSSRGRAIEYSYSTKRSFKVPLKYVPASIAAIINSYWMSRVTLEVSANLGDPSFSPLPSIQPDSNLITDPHLIRPHLIVPVRQSYWPNINRAARAYKPSNPLGKGFISIPPADGNSSSPTAHFAIANFPWPNGSEGRKILFAVSMKQLDFVSSGVFNATIITNPTSQAGGSTPSPGLALHINSFQTFKRIMSISTGVNSGSGRGHFLGCSISSYSLNYGEVLIDRIFAVDVDSSYVISGNSYYGDWYWTASAGSFSRQMYISNKEAPLRSPHIHAPDQYEGFLELTEF